MQYVCNDSGGLCSFWAVYHTVQKYGPENVVRLFADTLIESPGLYDFMDRSTAILGVPVTRITTGETPWELFEREGMIGKNRFPICSVRLKREPLDRWHRENCMEMDTTLILGFDWNEPHRLKSLREELPGWNIEAPMVDDFPWDKCRMQREAEALGLKVSDSYDLGLPHDNCGGGCVRAGISHWVHLHKVRPLIFAQWEAWEQKAKGVLIARGIAPLSMLKDRRGGVTRDLYLTDLRIRIEAGEKFNRFEWGGCGCGGATQSNITPSRSLSPTAP